jgi:tetratricopeptide (TPR) repeat protein
VLFYVNLVVISLVNLILIYAMFSYFVLHQSPLQIQWLLGVFATEIVGCFVLGWRKLVEGESKPAGAETRPGDANLLVVGRGPQALAIEKTKVKEDADDPDVILKGKGVKLLVLARDNNFPPERRRKYARRAIKIFARIPKGSAAYVAAQYNIATAHRTLANYSKALGTYEKVKELVAESGAQYTADERREWAADIERMIGNVYHAQNLPGEAKHFYLRSWKLAPDNLIGMLNLFDVAVELNKVDEARMWAEMLSTHEDYPSVSSLIDSKLNLLQKGPAQSAAPCL